MKHKLRIRVSGNRPQTGGIPFSREKLLRVLFGGRSRITVLIPDDSEGEIAICETGKGGEENGQDEVTA